MDETVENRVLEHLRGIRGDLHAVKDDMSGVRAEIVVIRQHVAEPSIRSERQLELTDV